MWILCAPTGREAITTSQHCHPFREGAVRVSASASKSDGKLEFARTNHGCPVGILEKQKQPAEETRLGRTRFPRRIIRIPNAGLRGVGGVMARALDGI